MLKLLLLRHGESIWNKENRFTGWTDVDLSEQGVKEAQMAGQLLEQEGYVFDIAFTSVLKRATRTLEIVLKEMNLENVPIKYSWRLNERHYGALQGLNKAQTAEKYGDEQVQLWRRSYDVRPPQLNKEDPRCPEGDPLYKDVSVEDLPLAECLKDTVKRFLPYWEKEIVPTLKEAKKVVIVAHGNSLRALVKYLDNISDQEIPALNIPTGIPLVYELDENLRPLKHYYLGDQKQVEQKVQAVKAQTKQPN